ncbi:MAG: zinc-dependent metalloprotease [Saprospiraceae bacterium]|nr:zinc-dependent metalloprotease [Saprospiraceae bacterium]
MKSKLFLLIFLCYYSFRHLLIAQNQHFCGQHHVTRLWFKSNPNAEAEYLKSVAKITDALIAHRGQNKHLRNKIIFTIPVVFHILHEDGPENISDAQILDQMRILNRDYQKLNADTINVAPSFKNNIAVVGFEFVLATIDPNGKCTNGIMRYYDQNTNWDANKIDNFTYTWPRDKYLNIYIVKKINIAPAYTYLPGTPIPAKADVIVCESIYTGSIGTATFDSRAITHEVGHWFGLPHTWGITNAPGVACGDDFVSDTPITKGFTSCTQNSKICNPTIEENFQNYMDYSPCKHMFTNGQADYMIQTLKSGVNKRTNLIADANLEETGVRPGRTCKINADFIQSTNILCSGESLKLSSLANIGKNTKEIKWLIPGGIPPFSRDSVLNVTFPKGGDYTVKHIVMGTNGSDSLEKIIRVVDGFNNKKPTQSYDFSNGTQVSDLEVFNPGNDIINWAFNPDFGAEDVKGCFSLLNINSNLTGGKHFFETPFFDFSDASKPEMSFYYSYAKFDPNQLDTFRVEYTLDCGKSWKSLINMPSANTMANNTGGITAEYFKPSKKEQWRKLLLSNFFSPILKNKPSVKFRFYFSSDPKIGVSNNLYIDEIQIWDAASTPVSEINVDEIIEIFPNPSSSQVTVKIALNPKEIAGYHLKDISGKNMDDVRYDISGDKSIMLRINSKDHLSSGLYFLVVQTINGNFITRKVLIL